MQPYSWDTLKKTPQTSGVTALTSPTSHTDGRNPKSHPCITSADISAELKMWKEIGFAISTPIGSCVNKKEKKILKIPDFNILKKKTRGDTVDRYLSTRFHVYSLRGFWEPRVNTRHQKQGPDSVWPTRVKKSHANAVSRSWGSFWVAWQNFDLIDKYMTEFSPV